MELNWTKNKPTTQGAYWVRGYHVGYRDEAALVEVREIDGELCSNLHETNSESANRNFSPIKHHSDCFEWCGPLVPANTEAKPTREAGSA